MFCITEITLIHFGAFCLYFAAAVLLAGDGLNDMTRRSIFVVLVIAAFGSINKMLLQNPCISLDFAETVYDISNFFWRANSPFAFIVGLSFSGLAGRKTITWAMIAVGVYTAFTAVLGYSGQIDVLVKKDFGYIAVYADGLLPWALKLLDDICNIGVVVFLIYGTLKTKNKLKRIQGVIFLAGTAISVALVYITRHFSENFLMNSANIEMLPALFAMFIAMKLYGFIEDTKAAAASYVFDASLEMMAILDSEKKVTEANSAFLSIKPEGFKNGNKPYFGFVVGMEESEKITGALEKEGAIKGRETVFEAGGRTFHGLISGYLIKRSGIISGYAIVITDITRIKEAEEELKSYRDHLEEMIAERTKELDSANASLRIKVRTSEDFIRASHHDIMEPIRAVSKMLQLALKKDIPQGSQARALVEDSVNYVNRLESLIYDIREYTMIEGGPETHRIFKLKDALYDAVVEMQSMIRDSGADIIMGDDVQVYGNRNQIKQVFLQLLGNSIKFRSGENPRIEIKAEKRNGRVYVSVSDNGIGIPEEYKERVFGAFERLHSREAYEGNGIGLAICAKIMELHGTRIWAEKGTRKGAVISFEMEG